MTTRANSNSKFLMRFLLIAAVFLGFGLYSLYDALVTGPKHSKKASTYWQKTDEGYEPKMSEEEWVEVAKENKWPINKKPKNPTEAKGYTYFNFLMAALCIPGGLLALWKYFQSNNTWVESDGKKLATSWGESFEFKNVTQVDKKKWDHKGIARIYYNEGGGEKVFVLDDFKYDRPPADEILYMLEKGLSDDQIVNGQREKSPEQKEKELAEKEAKEAAAAELEDE